MLSMKHWGQRYVQYLNRTYRRSGTLWEERFCSCLMQAQDYVLACEGLSVDQRPCQRRGQDRPAVRLHEQYLLLASDPQGRGQVYRALFKAHLDGALVDPIREVTNGNYGEIVACPLLRPLLRP